jgi:hypothetical protein
VIGQLALSELEEVKEYKSEKAGMGIDVRHLSKAIEAGTFGKSSPRDQEPETKNYEPETRNQLNP